MKKLRVGLMISSLSVIVCMLIVILFVHYWGYTEAGRVPPKTAVLLHAVNNNLVPPDMKVPQLFAVNSSPRFTSEYIDIPVSDGSSIRSKIYKPIAEGPHPIILYYHGGAFMEGYGNIDTHDNIVRSLAARTNSIVIAVGYRVAPDYAYPTAAEDSYEALVWAEKNAELLNGDPTKIAVAGDSSGGNLATVVTLMSRDRNGPAIQAQALLYPLTTFQDVEFDSRLKYDSGYYLLSRSVMMRARESYTPFEATWADPYTSPLHADDLSNLPPAIIITAEFDPLRDEGEEYARLLAASGVPVKNIRYNGVMHGFISFYEIMYRGNHGLAEASLFLRSSFQSAYNEPYEFQVYNGSNKGSVLLRDEAEAYAIGSFLLGKQIISLLEFN
ncbi:alpha/beta hydrolase [Bacillus sp. YZJH907-2]|uniref:Alpha/beta hydrolase n=2 Tax=Halalkalibacter suaedae TaxID=2822140 RepID=A0A941ARM9_9BACI|nr:alpha/beta hydrolase [Bacillus suaedae]